MKEIKTLTHVFLSEKEKIHVRVRIKHKASTQEINNTHADVAYCTTAAVIWYLSRGVDDKHFAVLRFPVLHGFVCAHGLKRHPVLDI